MRFFTNFEKHLSPMSGQRPHLDCDDRRRSPTGRHVCQFKAPSCLRTPNWNITNVRQTLTNAVPPNMVGIRSNILRALYPPQGIIMNRISMAAIGLAVFLPFLAPLPSAKANPGSPVIEFETNFFDFGKIVAPGKISGAFRFKNAGDGILKLEPPEPSCGCTDAKAVPDTLAPGQNGEITYTINLDHPMGQVRKRIAVRSNDPRTPEVQLTVQLDFTPLYLIEPAALQISVPVGQDSASGTVMVARTDGKPLAIERLASSETWLDAAWESNSSPGGNSANLTVTVHRPKIDPAGAISADVQLWAKNFPDRPMQTLPITAEIQGELSATPSQLYWVFPDFGNAFSNYPPESLTRTIQLVSRAQKPVTIKNARASIKGVSVQVAPKADGKFFDVTLKFNEMPTGLLTGKISFETSLASQPKLEVPLIVSAPAR